MACHAGQKWKKPKRDWFIWAVALLLNVIQNTIVRLKRSFRYIFEKRALQLLKFFKAVNNYKRSSQKENYCNFNYIFEMKVHLIRKETIEEFARHNAQSRTSLEEWLMKVKNADWEKPTDMQVTFSEC